MAYPWSRLYNGSEITTWATDQIGSKVMDSVYKINKNVVLASFHARGFNAQNI